MSNKARKITGKSKKTSVRVNPELETILKSLGMTTQQLLDKAYLKIFDMAEKPNLSVVKALKEK